MQNIDKNRPFGPGQAARDSAIMVAGISVMMAAIAALAAICLASIWFVFTKWQHIVWAITLGVNFWGGFTVSVLGLFAGAVALATAAQLDEDKYSRAIAWLKVGGHLGIGLSVLAQVGLVGFWTGGAFGKLTTPQVLALWFPISCTVMYLLYNAHAALLERT